MVYGTNIRYAIVYFSDTFDTGANYPQLHFEIVHRFVLQLIRSCHECLHVFESSVNVVQRFRQQLSPHGKTALVSRIVELQNSAEMGVCP